MVLDGATAVLATRHGKERAIAPVLERALGLRVEATAAVDTDQLGTFAGDVPRRGSPLETARLKARAGLAARRDVDWALASEGTLGPHPASPFAIADDELVVLLHRRLPIEVVGRHLALPPLFDGECVRSAAEGLDCAERLGFPVYGVIVTGAHEGRRAPARGVFKDVRTCQDVWRAVGELIAEHGEAWVETDARADRNPARMQAIAKAAEHLAGRARQRCPLCAAPGFVVVETMAGLPCHACGEPTPSARGETSACWSCGHRSTFAQSGDASPGECSLCNP